MSQTVKIEADVPETRRLYEVVRRVRSAEPERFAGCNCGECLSIGKHWETWLPGSLKEWLETLGVDWRQPFEVVCVGELGKETTVIRPDFVGVGETETGHADFPSVGVLIQPGNHSPGSWLPDGFQVETDSGLYTLSLNFAVGVDLGIRTD